MGFFKRLFNRRGIDSQSPSTSSLPPSPTTSPSTPSPISDKMATQGAPSFLAPVLKTQSTPSTSTDSPSSTSTSSPAFDSNKVTVIFVLGGPGAGKGTQCARLVEEHQFVHLSAGDLLRAEQTRSGSKYGEMIKTYIKEGRIVPMEVTIKLLENAMREKMDNAGGEGKGRRFLIDGFPRQMDQAVKFDESVCKSSLVLFLVCPEPILLERLLERGKTSGRDDDNEESIKKRFQTFINTSMPVVDYYRKQGKVVDIDSSKPIETVYEEIVQGIKPVLSST